MDSAVNRVLAGFLLHINHMADAASSCTYLIVPIRPALAILFMLVAAFLDVESLIVIVLSMCVMLLDFLQTWPFNLKSKHQAAKDCLTSHPVTETGEVHDWTISLDPDNFAVAACLSNACENVFGSSTKHTGKLISLGSALIGPPQKPGRATARALDAVARITTQAIPGAKVYGFERARSSPGYPGGTLEVVVVMPAQMLVDQLGQRLKRGMKCGQKMLSSAQLHKSALRYLIDHLVSEGFRFRCSAFKAQEPSVAVSAPYGCVGGQGVYVSLSVNNALPFLETSIMREASVSDPRVVPLVATVQRWAEARGLAHPVFGPLSMYGWVHACLFYLAQVAQPRMQPFSDEPSCKGFLQPDEGHPAVDAFLLEKFFGFCSRFAFGQKHIWLRQRSFGADAPFIDDALRPGSDLGYHLQHRVPRKQLQAEAALAANTLKDKHDIRCLAELGPLKAKPGHRPLPAEDNPAYSELRMMKTTRSPQTQPPNVSEIHTPSPVPSFPNSDQQDSA